MQFIWFLLLLLSGCAEVEPQVCGQKFCLPTQAKLVGKQEVADFNTYQVDWGENRFGIYEGDFPDFDGNESEAISIPIDANAQFFADSGEGHVLARLDSEWPQFLHVIGPCSSRSDCAVIEAAGELTRRR